MLLSLRLGRNSKLTMLLQDSLGGDAKALMFCNVAPVAVHAGDTFSSLAFASKVRPSAGSAPLPLGCGNLCLGERRAASAVAAGFGLWPVVHGGLTAVVRGR